MPFHSYSVTVPPFETGDPSTANAAYRPDAALLGRLNVRYVTAEFDLLVEGLQLEEQFGNTRVYRNLLEAPRVWLQPSGSASTQPAPVPELLAWNPDRIEVRAQGPGTLVLSEIAYPGWRVWVDGVSQPVESFDGLLRSVPLSAGEHLVVFAFRPVSLALGWVGFALGVACLVAAAWIAHRSRRIKQTPVEAA